MSDRHEINEQDIESYFSGKTEESRLYQQAEKLSAPDHLAFAVKKMARDALNNEPVRAASSARPIWPMAIAAGVLAAVVLGVMYYPAEQQQIQQAQQQNEIKPQQPETGISPAELEQLVEIKPDSSPAADSQNRSVNAEQKTPSTELALVETEQTQTQQIAVRPAQPDKPANDVRKQEQPIPDHLKALLQPASVNQVSPDSLPPAEVLKQWSLEQWLTQIRLLQQQDRHELEAKYREAFTDYFPDKDLTALLKR